MHGLPVDTDSGPPIGLPLRFFLAGFAFLIAAALVGALDVAGVMPGLAVAAHAHLLLAGWACLTILGAMAQFVPTWSGEHLHQRRGIELAFPLVALGVGGLTVGLSLELMWLLPVAGIVAAVGFWSFVHAMGRTLLAVKPWDATEAHFALALVGFGVVPALGLLLALDFATGILGTAGISHAAILGAHATLAVFGIVVVTILGALVQLAVMFTQRDPDSVDQRLLRLEQATYPLGVALLAGGRLLADPVVARVGVVLLGIGLLAFGVVLTRLLLGATVDYTPMHTRYGIVALSLIAWPLLAVPVVLATPLSYGTLFGPAGARSLLLAGVVAFTILGTLYHVVPFLVWLDRYADRVGLEPVPAIDDLYIAQIATLDLVLTVGGLMLLVGGAWIQNSGAELVGAGLFFAGVVLAVANMVGVVLRHLFFEDEGVDAPAASGDSL